MGEAGNPVSLLPGLLDLGSHLLDDPGEVATDRGPGGGEMDNVLPIIPLC